MTIKDKKLTELKLKKLITAIVCGDNTTIQNIVEKHSEVINLKDKAGISPLHYCVEYGNIYAARLLIEHHCDINIKNRLGNCVLSEAISKKQYPNRYLMVKLLLEKGCDVHCLDNKSRTPLYLAKVYDPYFISLLKQFGAKY